MSASIAIVWLRQDLRLQDNPALYHASQNYAQLIPLYIYPAADASSWAMGAASRWWLHHSLAALNSRLQQHDAQLILQQGEPLAVLQALLQSSGATTVYWNRCYEPDSIARDKQLKAQLLAQGIQVKSFNSALLHEPWTVQNQTGQPYQVFTPFWKACQKLSAVATPLPLPAHFNSPATLPDSVPLSALQLLPTIDWATGLAKRWRPGEAGAWQCLQDFCPTRMLAYAEQRDFPAQEGVSQLSPHLHFGEISPRQIYHAAQHALAAEKFIAVQHNYLRQLYWREFAYHILYHFPHTPQQPLKSKYQQFPWQSTTDELLTAWQQGRTGFPIVDAGMRELWTTGWMHNRVRMITASFLTKNCLLHWSHGAEWFWDTLVDADLANNSLGWQWVAGCGADAAPYYRIFNPLRQSEKFDPEGIYLRRWLPELATADNIHAPSTPAQYGYPAPIVDYQASRQAALAAYETLSSQ